MCVTLRRKAGDMDIITLKTDRNNSEKKQLILFYLAEKALSCHARK